MSRSVLEEHLSSAITDQDVGGVPSERLWAMMQELETSRAKLILHHLAMVETATADELKANLDIKLITVFPVLSMLEHRGIVHRSGEHYRLGVDEEAFRSG